MAMRPCLNSIWRWCAEFSELLSAAGSEEVNTLKPKLLEEQPMTAILARRLFAISAARFAF